MDRSVSEDHYDLVILEFCEIRSHEGRDLAVLQSHVVVSGAVLGVSELDKSIFEPDHQPPKKVVLEDRDHSYDLFFVLLLPESSAAIVDPEAPVPEPESEVLDSEGLEESDRGGLVDFVEEVFPLEDVDGGVLTPNDQLVGFVLVNVAQTDGEGVVTGHVPVFLFAI